MSVLQECCDASDVFKNSELFSLKAHFCCDFIEARNALLKFRLQVGPFSAFCSKANRSCKVLNEN